MALKYLQSIDLNHNELQYAVVQNAGTLPTDNTASVTGQLLFNSDSADLRLFTYNGSKWEGYLKTTDQLSVANISDLSLSSGTLTVGSTSIALYSKSEIDTALDKYLPLSGGEMEGTLSFGKAGYQITKGGNAKLYDLELASDLEHKGGSFSLGNGAISLDTSLMVDNIASGMEFYATSLYGYQSASTTANQTETWWISKDGDASFKSVTSTSATFDSITIGGCTIEWDADNVALKFGTAIYSLGAVSTKGAGDDSAGGGAAADLTSVVSDILPSDDSTYNIGSSSLAWKTIYADNIYIGGKALGDLAFEDEINLSGYVNSVVSTGSGNAVTSVTKSGSTVTVTKGSTFALASELGNAATYDVATSVTSGSTSLVTSGAVYSKLSSYVTSSELSSASVDYATSAGSATKLSTARTIWGQSFDGSGAVSGGLFDVSAISGVVPTGGTYTRFRIGTDANYLYFQTGVHDGTSQSGNLMLCGINGYSLESLTMKTTTASITGNLGIGITNPLYKLHVAGSGYFTDTLYVNGSEVALKDDVTNAVNEAVAELLGDDSLAENLNSLKEIIDYVKEVENDMVVKSVHTFEGDGATTSKSISHTHNKRDLMVFVYEESSPYQQVFVDVQMTSSSVVTITFAEAPAEGTNYKVILIG